MSSAPLVVTLRAVQNFTLNIAGQLLTLNAPVVMGIVNVTPDSFFAGSRVTADDAIAQRVQQIVAEGGAMVDVGAYSTRPGCSEVSADEEMRRLRAALTVVRRVAPELPLSIDTFRPDVARMCVTEFGAAVVNDVSGGSAEMYATVAELHVPYVLTYNNMHARRHDDVVVDCLYFLAERRAMLHDMGVADIIVDPGLGFNKSTEECFELMSSLERLHELDCPVLVGASRKSMVYRTLGITPDEALNGTTVLHTIALQKGVQMLRVHDVREAVQAITLCSMIRSQQSNNTIQCFYHSR